MGVGRTRRPRPHRKRRGQALLLALVAVFGVAALSTAMLQVASSAMRRAQGQMEDRRAFYVAEAALAEAYLGLAEGRTGSIGAASAPARFGDGLCWVESTLEASGHVTLTAHALCGSGRSSLALVAEPVISSVTALGIFSSDDVRIEPDSLVDGYDSSLGSYESQADMTLPMPHTPGGAVFGSNGNIEMAGGREGSFVYGDALPGPGGSFTPSGNTLVTGSTTPRTDTQELPPVAAPLVVKAPPLVHNLPTPLVVPPSVIGFSSLTMASGTQLVIKGPATVVFDELLLSRDAQLIVDPSGGRVDIYIEKRVDFAALSRINCLSTNPALLTMLVTAEQDPLSSTALVQLNASGRFYGTLYAPRAGVRIASAFEVFGAAVTRSLTLSNGGRLHVDLELMANASRTALPRLDSWRVVDVPDAIALNRADPFVATGMERADVLDLVEAHEDVWLDLHYTSVEGTSKTWAGWESEFDWEVVGGVSSFKTYTDDPRSTDSRALVEKTSMGS